MAWTQSLDNSNNKGSCGVEGSSKSSTATCASFRDVLITDGTDWMQVSFGAAVAFFNLTDFLMARLDGTVIANATTRFPDLVVTPIAKLAQPNVKM